MDKLEKGEISNILKGTKEKEEKSTLNSNLIG